MPRTTAEEKSLADTRSEANGFILSEDMLSEIAAVEDAFEMLTAAGIQVEEAEEYGSGFTVLTQAEKSQLVGKEMLLVEWRFTQSKEFKGEFVSVACVTRDGGKFIFNDGSTGVCRQLRAITDKRIMKGRNAPQAGLSVRKGLRKSEYDTTMEINGETQEVHGTTFYLAI